MTDSMKSLWLVLWLVTFSPSAFADEPLKVISATPTEELNDLFRRTRGWLGADGNYSVALSNERILWFFSDTWLGDIENGKRTHPKMINNSVGVMTTSAKGREVKYYWNDVKEKPTAFFQPEEHVGWFWPVAGVFANGQVHLLLWQMEKAAGPAAFAFRNIGVWHAVIDNPNDEPSKWRIKQTKLPFTQLEEKQRILFGSAALIHGEHAYFYGTIERPREKGFGRRMVVARVNAKEIADFKQWQFRSATGWTEDFSKAEPLAKDVASEYSVTPLGQHFVLVTHEAMLSPRIVARTAPQPWGPWSEAAVLYSCPEAKKSKDIFCYSGKAHAELSSNNELTLTYAANSHRMSDVLNDPQLYWPQFVKVKLAPSR